MYTVCTNTLGSEEDFAYDVKERDVHGMDVLGWDGIEEEGEGKRVSM